MPFANTCAERHRETLAVLQEAVDYIKRLPQVPATREVWQKLQSHIDAPDARQLCKQQDVWEGVNARPDGVIGVQVTLVGNIVTLSIDTSQRERSYLKLLAGRPSSGATYDEIVLDALSKGVSIELRNCGTSRCK